MQFRASESEHSVYAEARWPSSMVLSSLAPKSELFLYMKQCAKNLQKGSLHEYFFAFFPQGYLLVRGTVRDQAE